MYVGELTVEKSRTDTEKGWKGMVEIVEKFRRNQSELLNSTRANECVRLTGVTARRFQAAELVLE